ncbi:MAG TPA: hypothetical protein V6D09_11730 [Leptolyngbyaceae cyanobacterium]
MAQTAQYWLYHLVLWLQPKGWLKTMTNKHFLNPKSRHLMAGALCREKSRPLAARKSKI